MELAASIKMQSMKIAEQLIKAREESKEDEKNYCTICYSNEIDPEDSETTITFECGHAFCSECTLGQLRILIEKADLEKIRCFEHECANTSISEKKLQEIS